jgi:acyl dehydratase
MAIDYEKIMSLETKNQEFSYSDRETMLYGLGIGFGKDPLNDEELKFVYERDLKTVPSMATVVSWGAGNMRESGINYLLVLHGEQRLKMHEPLPHSADILVDSSVKGVFDKGKEKGALIITETDIKLKENENLLCTLSSTTFARGDGGFGGPSDGAPEPHLIPERKSDDEFSADTEPNQALIYRLSGDRNPLHSDPEIAKAAGFDIPILHGLCTYGTACRTIISNVCDYDSTLIEEFNVRFSSPVYPGEKISTEIWKDDNVISFRCWVRDRNVMVLNNGKCVLKK